MIDSIHRIIEQLEQDGTKRELAELVLTEKGFAKLESELGVTAYREALAAETQQLIVMGIPIRKVSAL